MQGETAANAWSSPRDKNLGLNFLSGHLLAGPQAGLCPQFQAPPFGYTVFFFFFHLSNGQTVSVQTIPWGKKNLIPINEQTGGSDVTIFLPRDQIRGKGSNAYEMPGICQVLKQPLSWSLFSLFLWQGDYSSKRISKWPKKQVLM